MSGPPNAKRAAPQEAAPYKNVSRQANETENSSTSQKFNSASTIAAAARHVLGLGERATFEFVADLARGRDVETAAADFLRIEPEIYRLLVAAMPGRSCGRPNDQ